MTFFKRPLSVYRELGILTQTDRELHCSCSSKDVESRRHDEKNIKFKSKVIGSELTTNNTGFLSRVNKSAADVFHNSQVAGGFDGKVYFILQSPSNLKKGVDR